MDIRNLHSNLTSTVRNGNLEATRQFINNLNWSSLEQLLNGFDILTIAIEMGHLEIAKFLISHGIRLSVNNTTALQLAVVNADLETVQMIVERGIEISSANLKNWDDPFFLLVKRQFDEEYLQILDYFLDKGVDINGRDNTTGFSLLHLAAINGNVDVVRLLLERKCDTEVKSFEGSTALHFAAKHGHPEVTSLLLQNEAKHDIEDDKCQTPLYLAAVYRNISTIEILLDFTLRKKDFQNEPYSPLKDDLLIFCASATGKREIIEKFFRKGAVINSFSLKTGKTALHAAVEEGHEEIVKLLLENGANPEGVDKLGVEEGHLLDDYNFHSAVESGDEEMVKHLLKRGVDPNSEKKGLVPLHKAAQKGHLEIVLLLLSYGVNVDFACVVKSDDAYTPLYIASYYGREKVVRALLEKGADPNVCFKKRLTPLHAAAQIGHKKIVKLLLKYGAEVNHIHNYHEVLSTPLLAAGFGRHAGVMKILLKNGASPNVILLSGFFNFSRGIEYIFAEQEFDNWEVSEDESKERYTPLHFAVEYGMKEIVDMILQRVVYIDGESKNKKTPLMLAIKRGDEDIIEKLLIAGANVNFEDSKTRDENENLMHCAVKVGNVDSVKKFIKYGSRIDSVCIKGLTPFFHAVESQNTEVLKVLLDAGAHFESKTLKGDTLLHFAIDKKVNENMFRFLLDRGADINAKDSSGLTPLHKLLVNGNRESKKLFKILLDYEADVNVHTMMAKLSVIHMSIVHGRVDEMKLLVDHGVNVNCFDMEEETPYTVAVKILKKTILSQNFQHVSSPESSASVSLGWNLNNSDFENYCRTDGYHNPDIYISIVRILTSELARLRAAGEKIQKQDLDLLEDGIIRPYYESCMSEIEQMLETNITDKITYFDVLVANKSRLTFYVRNEDVRNMFQSTAHQELFPRYGASLDVRYKKRLEKIELFHMSAESLEKAFASWTSRKCIKIPILIVHEIFSYLRSPDLKKLCMAS